MRMRRGLSRLPFALGLLGPPLLVFGVWLTVDQPNRSGRAPTITFESFREDPLEAGVSTSLAEAKSTAPIPIYIPVHERASESSISGVWITDPEIHSPWPQVAITFDSGLVIIEEQPQFADATSEFEGLVKGSLPGVDARVVDVGGIDSLVIERDSDADKENPASAQLVMGDASPKETDGVSVTIYSEDFSGTELVEILATLRAPT